MTQEQVMLVKRTWRAIRDVDAKVVGDTFYSKLFTDNPSLRKMFPEKMDEQYTKLLQMLNTIVARLDRLEELSGAIVAMSARHAGYGVRPAHFKMVGTALLWTLENALAADWTKEVQDAWVECYTVLSQTMIAAMQMAKA